MLKSFVFFVFCKTLKDIINDLGFFGLSSWRTSLSTSWALLGPSWAPLGPSWALSGHLGGLECILGPSWRPETRSIVGPSWRHIGTVLGPSWILRSRIQKPGSSSYWKKLHFKPEARWRIRSSASTALRSQSAPMHLKTTNCKPALRRPPCLSFFPLAPLALNALLGAGKGGGGRRGRGLHFVGPHGGLRLHHSALRSSSDVRNRDS